MRFWRRAETTEVAAPQKTVMVAPEIEKIADLIGRLEAWLEMGMLTPSGHTLLMEARQQYDILGTEAEMLRRGLDPTKPPQETE